VNVHWLPLEQARVFIGRHHRHKPKLQGGIVALGLWVDGVLRGVAVVGRGARMDSGGTAVITRLCTDGCFNGCSKLYSKAKRLAQALGFVGIKTFTREDESGASLFAVGAKESGLTSGGHWSRTGRQRDTGDLTKKQRWYLSKRELSKRELASTRNGK
jgi:hypothetical protein